MKTLLLAMAFMFSVSLSEAGESLKKSKPHNNVPKGKISHSEKKYKKTTAKKKHKRTRDMFAGEGTRAENRWL